LQSRLAMNEGKDKMFEETLIGPQRKAPLPVIEAPPTTDQPQEAIPDQSSTEHPVVAIKEEPMDVEAETSTQVPGKN
jgi:hypothetical protein